MKNSANTISINNQEKKKLRPVLLPNQGKPRISLLLSCSAGAQQQSSLHQEECSSAVCRLGAHRGVRLGFQTHNAQDHSQAVTHQYKEQHTTNSEATLPPGQEGNKQEVGVTPLLSCMCVCVLVFYQISLKTQYAIAA